METAAAAPDTTVDYNAFNRLCWDKLSDELYAYLNSSFDANPLIDEYGTQSATFLAILDLAGSVQQERFAHGADAANDVAAHGVVLTCHDPDRYNEILGLSPGDPGFFDPPDESEYNPTTTVAQPNTAAIPDDESELPNAGSAGGDGMNPRPDEWWNAGPQPPPDFLTDQARRWTSGEIPPPYADCPLAGSLSAPADWGVTGDVMLTANPDGGWQLTWPGDNGQYIRILAGTDIDNDHFLSDLAASNGIGDALATAWPTTDGQLVHLVIGNCWYQIGVSPDAPLGAQRAFFQGLRLVSPTTDSLPSVSTPSAEGDNGSACPRAGIDTLQQGDGIPEPCEGVRQLQDLLSRSGYPVDTDGRFGPGTKTAVIQFQTDQALPADGAVDPHTWNELTDTQVGDT